jgi:hypothetical protein
LFYQNVGGDYTYPIYATSVEASYLSGASVVHVLGGTVYYLPSIYNFVDTSIPPMYLALYTEIITSPPPESVVTSWTRAIDYELTDYTLNSSNSTQNSPMRRTSTGASLVASGYTSSTGGAPWAFSVVFKASVGTGNRTLVAQSDGSGGNAARSRLYIGGGGNLQFQYGTNFNYLKFTSTAGVPTNAWVGYYVDYNGGTTGAGSGALSTYYSRFRLKQVDLATGTVSGVAGTWSHQNYGFQGSVLGQLYVGSLFQHNENFRGKIGAVVLTTLRSNVALPDDTEVKYMTRDPTKWVTDYKAGQPWRKPNLYTDTSNFQVNSGTSATGGLGTKVYLQGDGTSDVYDKIKNQISINVSSNFLKLKNMAASNIVVVTDYPM